MTDKITKSEHLQLALVFLGIVVIVVGSAVLAYDAFRPINKADFETPGFQSGESSKPIWEQAFVSCLPFMSVNAAVARSDSAALAWCKRWGIDPRK